MVGESREEFADSDRDELVDGGSHGYVVERGSTELVTGPGGWDELLGEREVTGAGAADVDAETVVVLRTDDDESCFDDSGPGLVVVALPFPPVVVPSDVVLEKQRPLVSLRFVEILTKLLMPRLFAVLMGV